MRGATGGFPATDYGYMHLALHEVTHALGLWHTTAAEAPPSNPIDDYVYEPSTWAGANNIMSDTWVLRKYLSPKQIQYLHYKMQTDPIVSNYTNYNSAISCPIGPGGDIFISSNVAINSNYTFPGNVTIQSGGHLTINACTRMYKDAKIIVETGGKLTINNGGISAVCNAKWGGIEVRGSTSGIQSIDAVTGLPVVQGMVELYRATLSDAKCAISVGRLDSFGNFVPGTGGGIVQSRESYYLNNIISVKFAPYWTPYFMGGIDQNISFFKKDKFVYLKDNINSPTPIAAIWLNSVHVIDILGCEFEDKDFKTSYAIRSDNAAVNVKDFCNSVASNGNCSSSKKTNISGFRYGLYINSSGINFPSIISNAIIYQDKSSLPPPYLSCIGIVVLNTDNVQITDNIIFSGERTLLSGAGIYMASGIYLSNCNGYVVENNQLFGTLNASGAQPELTSGLIVHNSGPNANLIYNNLFKGHHQSINCQDQNYNPSNGVGLKLNCNDYKNANFNVGVTSNFVGGVPISISSNVGFTPITLPPSVAGIALVQGSILNPNQGISAYARNTYNTFGCNGTNKFLVNTNGYNLGLINHGSFNATQFHPIPVNTCSDPNKISCFMGLPWNNLIKSQYCTKNSYQTWSPKMLNESATAERLQVKNNSDELNANLDGGNTNSLLNQIQNSNANSLSLYNTLMAALYLSDEALVAYFGKTGEDHIKLYAVFAKNAPVSSYVWNAVQSIGLSNSELQTWSSQQNNGTTSKRDSLQIKIKSAKNELGLINNEKIRRFYFDVNENLVYDSLVTVFNSGEIPNGAIRIVDLNISTGHYTAAQNKINELREIGSSNVIICDMLQYCLNLKSDINTRSVMRGDTTLRNYLIRVATCGYYLVEGYAKALLMNVYDEKPDELMITLSELGTGQRNSLNNEPNVAIIKTEIIEEMPNLRIYPNPNNGRLVIENFETEGALSVALVVNTLGQQVCNKSLDHTTELDLKFLSNGIYFVNLFKNNKCVGNHKIVIMK